MRDEIPLELYAWRFYQNDAYSHPVKYVYLPEYRGWWSTLKLVVCDYTGLSNGEARDAAQDLERLSGDLHGLLRGSYSSYEDKK